MTKAEIVTKIAKRTGLDKDVVLVVVEQFMGAVKESLVNEEPVFRNISKETSIVIPAHNIPAFKPAKSFIAQVSGEIVNEEA